MNALENIRKIVHRIEVEKIVVDDAYVARHFVYCVDGKYILVNEKDWNAAVAWLYMETDDSIEKYTRDVPVVIDRNEAEKLSNGIYTCSLQVK